MTKQETIQERIKTQKNKCERLKYPNFAPTDGVCSGCRRQIYERLDGNAHITGCPYCNKSYCD